MTREIGAGPMLRSAVLAVVGTALIGRVWAAFLAGVGVRAAAPDVSQVFFVTQLGKYLPGSVWPVVAQIEAGRRWTADRSTMLVASALMLVMLTVTGLAMGIILLPWASGTGLQTYWWTTILLLPLAALLHPKVTPWLLDRALTLLGREPAGIQMRGRAMLVAASWSLIAWGVLGVHIYVLVAALGAAGVAALSAAVGGMALAWAIGLIVIPAPAGAGIRDTVLILTMSPFLGSTAALTVALASRMILLCADLLLAGLSIAIARWCQSSPSRAV